ncbi:AAA family ATPase [Selenomonas ruminantium]|uniref:AAA family ATPase n=1 Tax=Selenomonas ruminantium TaxID=971 RepID=UPI0026ED5112|nr:AAA family ATPase [Selenomonas ruminantium]
MYINWIEYESKTSGQKINHVEFNRLNLLVGASAAGKTSILRVISKFIMAISLGHSIKEQCKFKICFSVADRRFDVPALKDYLWEIETKEEDVLSAEDTSACPILREKLQELSSGNIIIDRQEAKIYIAGYENIPQISKTQSTIFIFRENNPFNIIVDDMRSSLTLYNQNSAFYSVSHKMLEQLKRIIQDANDNGQPLRWHYVTQSKFPVSLFIYIVKNTNRSKFDAFLEDLQDIFPEIEDVHLNQYSSDNGDYYLSIKQKGHMILQPDISSGVMRTIYILACIHFCEPSSVIMFDELENSLGVNCLDEMVERIIQKSAKKQMQFLLTSHHPYIINQLPTNSWLVISQKDGIIDSKKASDLGLGKMKQDNFFDLINYLKRQFA